MLFMIGMKMFAKRFAVARIVKELVVELVKIDLRGLLMAEDLDDLLAVHHFFDEAFGLAERVLLAGRSIWRICRRCSWSQSS